MDQYNYREAVYQDCRDAILSGDWDLDYSDEEALYGSAYDDFFASDSITGNASGSYTFNTWKAEEYIAHNLWLLGEALDEFGEDAEYLFSRGAEAADVTIRCYLLSECLTEAIKDLADEELIQFEEEE